MKRNHIMRTSAIVLALVLATACLVSGTFAKYTASVYGKDTARVAYFEVGSDTLGTTQDHTFNLWDTHFDANVYHNAQVDADSNIGEDGYKLLAPCTRGQFDLKLWGKAEVDTFVDYDFTLTTDAAIPLVFFAGTANTSSTLYYSDYFAPGTTVKLAKPLDGATREFVYTPADQFLTVTIQGTLADMADHTSIMVPAGRDFESYLTNYDSFLWFWAFEEQAEDGTIAAGDDRDTALGNDAVDVTYVNGNVEEGRIYTINEIEATLDVKVTVNQID